MNTPTPLSNEISQQYKYIIQYGILELIFGTLQKKELWKYWFTWLILVSKLVMAKDDLFPIQKHLPDSKIIFLNVASEYPTQTYYQKPLPHFSRHATYFSLLSSHTKFVIFTCKDQFMSCSLFIVTVNGLIWKCKVEKIN